MDAKDLSFWLGGADRTTGSSDLGNGVRSAPDATATVMHAGGQAIDSATVRAHQMVEGVQAAVQRQLEQFQAEVVERQILPNAQLPHPQAWMTQPLQNWLSEHPLIGWMAHNPLWAIGGALLSILLLSGLVKAIARFSEQAWLSVLQSPFRLGQWLLRAASKSSQHRALASAAEAGEQERLSQILSQLEVLRLQQEALLQELKTLLAAREKQ